MKERLFLNRVDVHRDDLPVNETVEGAVPVFAYRAYPPMAVMDEAIVGAEPASDVCAVKPLIEHRFLHKPHYTKFGDAVNPDNY
jgi:hypothetical protein